MKDILPILIVAACPLSMLAMGAGAWFSRKLWPGRHDDANQPAHAQRSDRLDVHVQA